MSKSHLALLIAIAASASCSAALRDDVPLDGDFIAYFIIR